MKEMSGYDVRKGYPRFMFLTKNEERRHVLEKNAEALALRNAAQVICDEVYKLV